MHLLLVIRKNAGSMNFKCQEPWFIFYIQFTDFNCRAITLLSKQVWAKPSEHYNYLFLSPYKFSLTSYFKTFPITIKEKRLATEIIFWICNWNPEFWQEMEKEAHTWHVTAIEFACIHLRRQTHFCCCGKTWAKTPTPQRARIQALCALFTRLNCGPLTWMDRQDFLSCCSVCVVIAQLIA